MKKILSKVNCIEVILNSCSENVVMTPVYSSDPNDPNKSFSDATPSGKIELCITNKSAYGFFRPGREFLVTFEDVTPTPETSK